MGGYLFQEAYLKRKQILFFRYKTELCKDGVGCTRKVCFFAHRSDELRTPSASILDDEAKAKAYKAFKPVEGTLKKPTCQSNPVSGIEASTFLLNTSCKASHKITFGDKSSAMYSDTQV